MVAFGHSGRVALGVYSYAPYWGGVNDFWFLKILY